MPAESGAEFRDPFLRELAWRGLLHQTAGPGLESHLSNPGRVAYCGFDPTGQSLTVGNLIPIKLLMHWQRAGHKPIFLIGGGTGLIGDPSGKDAERQLMTRGEVEENVAAIRTIFERLLNFDASDPNAAVILNNLDWLDNLKYLEVLRDIGKHFSVNVMIQKDSVKERLRGRDHGITYTEFSYMVLQAYDFLHLYRAMNCTVQIAGSDQYGNIVAGMDLIRREFGGQNGEGFGITAPLVTRADGKKIGKTEKGAIWLTPEKTSPYAFFQYWMNAADTDVIQFLKWFTFLDADEIAAIDEQNRVAPHKRVAQRALAEYMTELLHGEDERKRATEATDALFGQGDVRRLDERILTEVFADVPHSTHACHRLDGDGWALLDLLDQTSLARSKRQAREFLENGALSVNGERVPSDRCLTRTDLLHGTTILLKRGKKQWHATQWE